MEVTQPNERVVACEACGASLPPPSRKGGRKRQYCSNACAKRSRYAKARREGRLPARKRIIKKPREKVEVNASCERCGVRFSYLAKPGLKIRRFCSTHCRYGKDEFSLNAVSSCKECGKPYKRKSRKQQYCSRECGHKPETHTCLNCHKQFAAKNRSRCAFKYCSRECAFSARRLKKPCAERRTYTYKALARWFHSWGDDQWPMTRKCKTCGVFFVKRSKAAEESCGKCRTCPDCGVVIQEKYNRRCKLCKKKADELSAMKSRQIKKFRKRCRHYGVPYKSFSRTKIFRRDRWRCQICGERLLKRFEVLPITGSPHPRSPTVDHIIPLSMRERSPGHCESNVQACCWDCNVRKGNNESYTAPRQKATLLH